MPHKPVRVLAIGWFGERNLGDEAMLEGLLALLRRAFGEVDVTVMTADPDGTRRSRGVRTMHLPALDRSGFRNPAIVRAMAATDLVTLGGGDLVRETRGAVAPARFWLRRLRVAHALRRPVAAIGISVGELRDPALVAETRDRLGRLAIIAARDTDSAARLRDLGIATPHVIGDLALEAPGAIPAQLRRSARVEAGAPRIGVATRELVGRGPGLAADAGERLATTLAEALDGLVTDRGASVELIPFRTRPAAGLRDDDERAGEILAARAATGTTWIRHPAPADAAAFAAVAAGMDAIVSVRLHGLVLGSAAGVPVAGIAYDPKVRGFLTDLGVPEQSVEPDAPAAGIRAAIERALDDPALADRITTGVAAARQRTAAFVPTLASAVRHGATR